MTVIVIVLTVVIAVEVADVHGLDVFLVVVVGLVPAGAGHPQKVAQGRSQAGKVSTRA